MDTKALFKIGYGLYIITAKDEAKDNGCIINTVMQVSSDPCKIAFSINKNNYTHDIIKKTKRANISVLSQKADFETFKHFGFQSGRKVDKFADFSDTERDENGILYITKNINSYFSLSVVQEFDLNSHTLFIANINDSKILCEDTTLTYDFYQKNIKPEPKKQEENKKKGWICIICNYVYEGEDLPSDFICPLCKHPASDFRKL